jgi:PAS domain S-box-containing protein
MQQAPSDSNSRREASAVARVESYDVGGASSHLVHFYESDEELSEVVSEFLAAGLAEGNPLVVVATEAHKTEFSRQLQAKGFDLARACESGQCIVLDARQTLSRFMVGSMPDAARFNDTFGPVLDELVASRPGAPVRAYGEMVDVLWKEGNAPAAIRLEEIWNDLQRGRSFSLLCAYVITSFHKQPADVREVCATHTHVVRSQTRGSTGNDSEAPSAGLPESARALVAEIAQRKDIERALRESLRALRHKEQELSTRTQDLRDFLNNGPIGLHWVNAEGKIVWANRAELELLGYQADEYIGHPIADFHVDQPVIEDILERLHNNEPLHDYETRLRAKDGSIKHVLISSNVRWQDGKFLHTRCFTRDVTERKRLAQGHEAAAKRSERLTRITAAIADAVTADQVFEAVVDQVSLALEASSAALWLVADDGRSISLVRARGYSESAEQRFKSTPLDSAAAFPALDSIRHAAPIWITSQQELVEKYPALGSAVTPGRSYRISCLPIIAQGKTLGCLGFTFEQSAAVDSDERHFLMLVVRYCGQALERLRLLEAERKSRTQAEASAARAELLYGLAATVIGAERVEEVYEAALDAIERALGATRSSILLFDRDGVMRFKAWRDLSDEYRRAVEGHSPWTRAARGAEPILVPNVEADATMADYLPLFRRERIAALGFIPLVAGAALIGKFMVYYDEPRELAPHELGMARAIANHAAAATARFEGLAELQQTVRFNELFTGILGHDLRNPLGAIMTAAQLALRRGESEKLVKPLSRILSSGERMARMIDQLLDFTRVRVGTGIPIVAKPVDLVPLLRHVIDELDDANPDWKLCLECSGDTEGVWDGDRLSQVFSNLVANAGQHGIVEHGVNVRINGNASDLVVIEIHNMGAIPTALLPKLFEPMAGGQRRREKSRGLGLGLYVSQEILKAHGGCIEVQSAHSDGTTFAVFLPRVAASIRESSL